MSYSRTYIEFRSNRGRYNYDYLTRSKSDPYDHARVRSFDQKLHRTLSKIFRERRLTSSQIRKLIRAPKKRTEKNSIFQLILEREPALGKLLLKRSKLSLLWIAVLSCYQDSVELLIRSGANVNERFGLPGFPINRCWLDFDEQSSLLHALLRMYPSSWNDRCIGLLIEYGADFKAPGQILNNSTVLHLAVEYDRVKVAEMLLEKGADPNVPNIHDITPLLEALRSSKVVELMPMFLKHGADVTVIGELGKNALNYLARAPGEHVDLARVLIDKGVSARGTTFSVYQPIHQAASEGKIELVELFLDHGADVNARGYDGDFPLIVATHYCKNPAMLLTLLKRGADVDMKTYSDRTALHYFTIGYLNEVDVEKLKILLSAGADMFAEAYSNGSTYFDIFGNYINMNNINNMNNPCIILPLKTLALKKACLQEPSVQLQGEKIVKKYRLPWNCYQDCIEEIDRIKATEFIKNCTLFELLTKCQCEIETLMRNHEFERKFRLCDLSVFSIYAEDILEAFVGAKHYYHSLLEQENFINEAVYNTLPYMIVRKVARYALNCEICEMKKIVQASRGKVK